MNELNKYSKEVTQDDSRPAAQSMLHAIGLSESDFKKAQIGIVSTGWEGNPCNMHLNGLAYKIKDSIQKSDLIGLIFHTIGVSDGISMGTDGMRFSLPSRDIIADSIETVVSAQWYDGVVAVVGCDKNMPGAIMGLGRLNRPSILVYGGTIQPGCFKNQKLDIVSSFEAYGKKLAGTIRTKILEALSETPAREPELVEECIPQIPWLQPIEVLGMSLPYNASNPAMSKNKNAECHRIGNAMRHLLENDIKPRDIMTRKAFENAITLIPFWEVLPMPCCILSLWQNL